MAQSQIQELTQQQKLQQSISQQQLLQAQLVELPITQLLERINTEMNDNPALEATPPDEQYGWGDSTAADDQPLPDYDEQMEREERQTALDEALQSIGRDDEDLPVYHLGQQVAEEREGAVYGETTSFYDLLRQQTIETNLTETQEAIINYVIGSLDDDGLLRKSTASIADELAIYYNINVSEKEIEQVIHILQTFDPPGIGARSLQECLLIQISRKPDGRRKDLMHEVIAHHFDEFTKKHWTKLQQALSLSDSEAEELQQELRRLNPKPGASLGEEVGGSMQQITPDFIVDTLDDGTVTFNLNNDVPQLQVSQSFADLLKDYQQNRDGLSKQMKEALLYTKQKVDAAQGFIEAVKQRRHTLTITMKAIIALQHRFFEDGDEASLRPMILKDVAERTGLDLSTISRVSNSKYAQTRWGTFPLRYFFSDGYTTDSGEELSTREIKVALRDLINQEDKKHPLSDDLLSDKLKTMGYPIARRTVAKYREQMGIPVARLRK